MSREQPSRLRTLDPTGWSRRGRTLALFAPAFAALLCFALAALMPEDRVWPHAAQAALLAAPRWILLFWGPWGILLSLRVPELLPAAFVLGAFGLATAGTPLPEEEDEGWLFVSANVNAFGEDPEPGALEKALAALDADVLVVLERRPESIPGLTRVADDFDDPMPRPSHASAVFCREGFPCEAEVTEQFGSDTMRMPVALVRVQERLCLLGVHAPPPAPYDPSGLMPYVNEVARHLADGRVSEPWGPCERGDPVVVAGDLNAVPWSAAWRALKGCCGLTAPLLRHGVFAATWPAGGGWPDAPYFPLDHLFVGQATVSGIRLARLPGADHKAIVYRVLPQR